MPHTNNMPYCDPHRMASLSAGTGNGGGYYDPAVGSGPGRVSAYGNPDPFAVGHPLMGGPGGTNGAGAGTAAYHHLPTALVGSNGGSGGSGSGAGRSRHNGGSIGGTSTSTVASSSTGSSGAAANGSSSTSGGRGRFAAQPQQPQQQPRSTASAWTPQDDEQLLQLRRQNLNWSKIHEHFRGKTANACRKRHERLQERRSNDDFDEQRLRRIAREYVRLRPEIWKPLAAATGEKWAVVEQKCMGSGFKTLQGIARAAEHRARLEASYHSAGGGGGGGGGGGAVSMVPGAAGGLHGELGGGGVLSGMHEGLVGDMGVYEKDDEADEDEDDETGDGSGSGSGSGRGSGNGGIRVHGVPVVGHNGLVQYPLSSPRGGGGGHGFVEDLEGPGSSPSSGSAGSSSAGGGGGPVRRRSAAGGHRSVSSASSTASLALQSHMLPPPPQTHQQQQQHGHYQQHHHQMYAAGSSASSPGTGGGYDLYAASAGFAPSLRSLGDQQQQHHHHGMAVTTQAAAAAAAAAAVMASGQYATMANGGHGGQ